MMPMPAPSLGQVTLPMIQWSESQDGGGTSTLDHA